MLLQAALLDGPVRVATALSALPLAGYAAATAPWSGWLGRADRQHVWLGSLVLLLLVWSLRAGITPGLTLQFLLVPALTLMHGWRLALVGVGALLAADGLQHGDWAAWPANLLCSGAVPALLIAALQRAVERRLPHNYFVYFFVTVFLGSMLAFNAAGLARLGLLLAGGSLPPGHRVPEYLLLLMLMSLTEGFINGIVMAVAVVHQPQWVASFDDRLYLGR
jgi:uncharacterized membrane protein